jgi:N-methylhydantoinase B/oxoprolinase/acetone carboxylase alpha subunit
MPVKSNPKQRHCASNAKSAAGLTFNFGALARLRCFIQPATLTNAGAFKPMATDNIRS